MKEVNLEELMELYRKTTQGEWIGVAYADCHGIRINIQGEDRGVGHINTYNQQPYDAEFVITIHNSLPALVERIRVAEKVIEMMAWQIKQYDEGMSIDSTVEEIIADYRKDALAQLREEGIDLGDDSISK